MAILLPLYADTSYEATRSYSHVGIPRDPEVVSVNDWAAEEIRLNLDAEEYIQAVLQSGNNAMRRGNLSLVNESELIPAIQILPTLFHTRRLEPSLQAIVKTYLENATNNDDASLVVAATIKSLLRVSRDKKSLAEMCSTLVIAEAQDKPKTTNTSATLAAIEVIAELAVDSERIRQSLVIAESKYSGSNSRASILKARKAIRNGKK